MDELLKVFVTALVQTEAFRTALKTALKEMDVVTENTVSHIAEEAAEDVLKNATFSIDVSVR